MSDTAEILFHPHNPTHETIVGCSFFGGLIFLCVLADVYRRLVINRRVLGPADSHHSQLHQNASPLLYAPTTGIRWHHQHAPEPTGDKTITEAIEDAAALGHTPQWVVSGRAGRPTSLQHPSVLSVGKALTSDEVSPVDTTPTTASTSKSIGFEASDSQMAGIPSLMGVPARQGEAWPLPVPAQTQARIQADPPVPSRKLSKSKKSKPDESGRRGKKSVAPVELPKMFGRASTSTALGTAIEEH
ncbi:MAG: hypothetical protein M1828_002662 [Chrysothrix sp. TS-e1954]|nr:MAG: hypothetical protein M1828_002662 [Chrysothrix sp. TS-e1954]